MPLRTVRIQPGVDTQETRVLNTLRWSTANLIRFKDGLPEKLGGWTHINPTPLVGTGRGMHIWADLAGTPYAAIGTEQRLQLFYLGNIIDITPLRVTHNVAVSFTTTFPANATTVKITDAAHGANVGDWVNIPVPVSVGGIIVQGFYLVQTVIDANNYTIFVTAPGATSAVANGGAVPSFNVSGAAVAIATVTLANHGFSNGALFGVQVQTLVGGFTIAVGSYVVAGATTNTFTITPGGLSTGAATVSENGGNVQLQYLVLSGVASATPLGGWGIGNYGSGNYGQGGSGTLIQPLRQWYLDNFGADLIGNYNGSPIIVWVPPVATGNVALAVNTTNYPSATIPPTQVNASFVAMPQQMVMALGCDISGIFDPNLVRWCDVGDFTKWQATTANQAGSFRIPTGSRIIGGIQGPQYGMLWTDLDFWLIQYLQPPLVFGFQKVSGNADLIAGRAVGMFKNNVYWASHDNFLVFDGQSAQVVPCSVWDKFFRNINSNQSDKVFCAVNSLFNEITWYYPSATSMEVDSYVKYQAIDKVWDYGLLARTCWQDDNVLGAPIGVDPAGLLQQHETSFDADGSVLMSSLQSGMLEMDEGTMFTFIERLIPDFVLGGSTPRVQVSIVTEDYPSDFLSTYGPYTITQSTPYVIVRSRNRGIALQISSSDLGSYWRLGALKYNGSPAGKRQ